MLKRAQQLAAGTHDAVEENCWYTMHADLQGKAGGPALWLFAAPKRPQAPTLAVLVEAVLQADGLTLMLQGGMEAGRPFCFQDGSHAERGCSSP